MKAKYIIYKIKWHMNHLGYQYKEMYPVWFNEWINNENEMIKD